MWGFLFTLCGEAIKRAPLYFALCAVSAVLSGYLVSEHYEAKAKEARIDAERAVAKQERESHERIVAIQNELDAERSRSDELGAQLERVRESARKAQARSHSPGVEKGADEECQRLLVEGATLLARGAELLRQNAQAHDALTKAVAN